MYTLTHEIEFYSDGTPDDPKVGAYNVVKETMKETSFENFYQAQLYVKGLIAQLNPFDPPCFMFYYTTEDNPDDPEHYTIEFSYGKSVDMMVDGVQVTEESHHVYLTKDK